MYELGTFPAPDLRPYFAMKLVKGQTLAALLADQPVSVGAGSVRRSGPDRGTEAPPTGHPRPVRDLPRFLSIFEAVCQTMAYAHARGVIHRDLKPSNIMVGSFGEVQVMDWGLAKVLPRGGIADEAAAQPARETVIMTVRSGSAGSGGESQAGSVLGTPAYMAPEQARGEIDRIDERADVFGLGAILCEILTGRPPFAGATREEIRAQSARGDLAGALGRLDACGAEAELIELARDCLAPEPARRPRNAGHVSRRMKAFLTGLQERLRTAELARVEAQARAVEEAKRAKVERDRRRLTVGLAASLLALMTIGGLSVAYLLHQEQARAARVERLLARAGFLRDEARARPEDTAAWEKARDALDQVEVAPDARARLVALIAEVQTGLAGAERLATLRQALVDIRSSQQDAGDEATDLAYAGAFRAVDLDLDALSPADAAAPIRRHSPPIVVEVATALDHWSEVRRRSRRPVESWRRPLAVARLADRDPYRDRLRGLIAAADLKAHAAELQALAGAPDATDLPAATALVLAGALVRAGAAEAAIATLRRAAARHPEDVWLSWNLAGTLANARTPRREEALGYYRAARSLRPETAHELAHYLEKMGQRDEAETVFRDLIRRRPGDPKHLGCYGKHLHERGRRDEARLLLERAVAAGREAVGRTPMEHHVVLSVGVALEALGRLDDAVAAYREAIRIERGYAVAHHNLGCTLGRQGKLEEAVAQFREAIQLNPDLADPHRELGAILCDDRHDYDGAIAEFRTAIRLKPDDEAAHCNLGVALNA
ncbi:MAG: tetratricopeptide repeat protein, partial [Isosphaeraceae bacterium]